MKFSPRNRGSEDNKWTPKNVFLVLFIIAGVVYLLSEWIYLEPSSSSLLESPSLSSLSSLSSGPAASSSLVDYEVSEECKNLPFIRPMGTYFLDDKIGSASSPEGVDPAFRVGSNFGHKATDHMRDDKPHFALIKELLRNREEGSLVLDFGANQGFFTWYLASLGMEVHSFEINEKNVAALQHGAEHNPPRVAERVHVYPVGLGESTGRMNMGGTDYGGHLRKNKGGSILASSFDCFAYHNAGRLGDRLVSDVAFVKLDVEGFEIAVLMGAKKSLLGPKGRVGGLLMEVGPSRWSRAGITLDRGIAEMVELTKHFENSYLVVRTAGAHQKTCPPEYASKLADRSPRILEGIRVHKVGPGEWGPLLKTMDEAGGDCNFWYTN